MESGPLARTIALLWTLCASAAGCSKDIDVAPEGTPYQQADAADCSAHQEAGAHQAVVGMADGKTCFAIDRTEVTRAQYEAFVAAAPKVQQPAQCAANTDFTTNACEAEADPRFPVTKDADHPIVCVDWCDAWSYCSWRGARLCKGDNADDAASSEWYAACSSAGGNIYPYGEKADPEACHFADTAACSTTAPCTTTAAGSNALCATQSGVMDLSGNVAEWTGECSGDQCHVRGGSLLDGTAKGTCKSHVLMPRNEGAPHVGFRCCAP